MTSNFIVYQDKKIHYTVQGRGETVVLLHGFMESLLIWKEFSELLSMTFQVICIDLPGHGKSDNIGAIHTMHEMAEIVKVTVESNNISEFVLIGHSMGGYVSLQFAESNPQMIKGLGLFHSHALADSDEAKNNRDRVCEIVTQKRKEFISQFIPELFAPENIQKFEEEIKVLQYQVKDISVETIIACMQGMKIRTEKLNVLVHLKKPFLFILGKQDSRVPYHETIAQALLTEHSDILLINVGHMGYIEAKDETLFSVKNFITKCYIFNNNSI